MHAPSHQAGRGVQIRRKHVLPENQAGLDGQQKLADNFLVAKATGSEAPQGIYVNRELDLDAWQLAQQVLFLEPYLVWSMRSPVPSQPLFCKEERQPQHVTGWVRRG
jgi:hypothetical protein